MSMLVKYKILSVGVLVFFTFSLYCLVLYQRIHVNEETKNLSSPFPLKLPQTEMIGDGNGTTTTTTSLPEKTNQVNQVNLEMESLNTYVMAALGSGLKNYLRPSSIFYSQHSVEQERRRTLEDLREEEFTIVMMTYKRTKMMLALLKHLSGMPKLNQLLLIWNNVNESTGPHIKWPLVDYPIRLLSNGKNSLHNRYLPLKIIETEGVFILDDDSFVVHQKVLLAFKKWQNHRDRIVGFKGRGVNWKMQNGTRRWEYNSMPKSDSISMVLTSSAFLHRNYFDLYTYGMPKEMRKIIDDTKNCDDLAVNFLISEVTQKGPIFVNHERDFLCEGCKDDGGLWRDPSHFIERTNCVNQFAEIYGYMPLFTSDLLKCDEEIR